MCSASKLENRRSQVAPLARQGMPVDQIAKQTDFERLKASFAGDDPWLRSLLGAFFLGSIVKNAAAEARGEPIVQGTS